MAIGDKINVTYIDDDSTNIRYHNVLAGEAVDNASDVLTLQQNGVTEANVQAQLEKIGDIDTGIIPTITSQLVDLLDLNSLDNNIAYIECYTPNAVNRPSGSGNGYLTHTPLEGSTGYAKQTFTERPSNAIHTRVKEAGTWSTWLRHTGSVVLYDNNSGPINKGEVATLSQAVGSGDYIECEFHRNTNGWEEDFVVKYNVGKVLSQDGRYLKHSWIAMRDTDMIGEGLIVADIYLSKFVFQLSADGTTITKVSNDVSMRQSDSGLLYETVFRLHKVTRVVGG